MKNILPVFFLIAVLHVFSNQISAQDIHYSQFYNSPLTVNPALTGRVNGTLRVAGIYRNQWASIISPFVTPSVSFDMPLYFENGKSAIGIGALILSDKSGSSGLTNQTIGLSSAIHFGIGEKSQLSFGLQLAMVQRRVDQTKLVWASDFNGFDPAPIPTDGLSNDNFIHGDMNGGFLWSTVFNPKIKFYAGVSFFHLTEPNESFLGEANKLPMRYLAHGGFEIALSDKIDLLPSLLWMQQQKFQELNLGAAFGFNLSDHSTLYLGVYDRLSDAFITYAGFRFHEFTFGFSYDITTSVLKDSNSGKGGFELSLIYTAVQILPETKSILFCPRF